MQQRYEFLDGKRWLASMEHCMTVWADRDKVGDGIDSIRLTD